MNHRAFAFDYEAFNAELRPVLLRALETHDTTGLERWLDANRGQLVDPYEGEPLATDWRALLDVGDVHEYGDFALTKFFDGDLDIGLDADWEQIGELLEESGLPSSLMLGTPLGPIDAPFDPGRQGAYFQTEQEVSLAFSALERLLLQKPALAGALAPLQGMLQQCASTRRGLYVTF